MRGKRPIGAVLSNLDFSRVHGKCASTSRKGEAACRVAAPILRRIVRIECYGVCPDYRRGMTQSPFEAASGLPSEAVTEIHAVFPSPDPVFSAISRLLGDLLCSKTYRKDEM